MSSEIKLKINGRELTAEYGKTILQVATENGIYIPHLCWQEGLRPCGSCGVCVVSCEGRDKLLRSCAAMAEDGMVIDTESKRALEARTLSLSLLMNEHNGDCIAPCSLACPAGVDCQAFIRAAAKSDFAKAIEIIKEAVPFPSITSRICAATCQVGCRRGHADHPLSILELERFCGDLDLLSDAPSQIECQPSNGKSIAIIGGGITGLACAYHLARRGFSAAVYDVQPEIGGELRYAISETQLPRTILSKELARLEALGVKLQGGTAVSAAQLASLRAENDAVVLASYASMGAWAEGLCAAFDKAFLSDALPEGVFHLEPNGQDEKALMNGLKIAKTEAARLAASLLGEKAAERPKLLSHRRDLSLLFKEKGVSAPEPSQAAKGLAEACEVVPSALDKEAALVEAARCLECGCSAFEKCRLLQAVNHGAELLSYEKEGDYAAFIDRRLGSIEYDKDKCILCGQCIQYCNNIAGKRLLDFAGRGNTTRVNCEFSAAAEISACKDCHGCVDVCPTGAMGLVGRY